GNIDIEAGYKMSSEKVDVRPYAGIRAGITHTEGFKERGEDVLRLEVKENNYVKTLLRAGIGLKKAGEGFRWNMSVGVESILTGRRAEIESKFVDTEEVFKSRSVEEGALAGEVDLGAGYNISDSIEIYANGRAEAGSKRRSLYGNIGVRYSF
ncbi:MAG: autotransporter outer membrane beta-barrel domain-containing protein, partial [Endomicrobium sp.]|nr:autotransporter outer membrane beta-barrel domain-containing protein [Endomicrobium sp.]